MKKVRDFMDEDHPIMMEYYEILESGISDTKMVSEMKRCIEEYPDFYDPYIIIYEIFQRQGKEKEALEVLDKGYKLALKRIVDKQGNFPDVMEWGWLENRHVIRIMLNKALELWKRNDTEESITIFRNLFNSNPYDNIGARFYILALLEGMSYNTYTDKYESDEYSNDVFEWFEKGRKKYSKEFKALEEVE